MASLFLWIFPHKSNILTQTNHRPPKATLSLSTRSYPKGTRQQSAPGETRSGFEKAGLNQLDRQDKAKTIAYGIETAGCYLTWSKLNGTNSGDGVY